MGTGIDIERANTVLYCDTWAPTVHFYRTTIALPVTFENDWFVEFSIGTSASLSIADASRATIGAVGGQGVTLTLRVSDVARVRDTLVARGVELTPITDRWGGRVCYCRDPEGHRIEFWTDSAEIQIIVECSSKGAER